MEAVGVVGLPDLAQVLRQVGYLVYGSGEGHDSLLEEARSVSTALTGRLKRSQPLFPVIAFTSQEEGYGLFLKAQSQRAGVSVVVLRVGEEMNEGPVGGDAVWVDPPATVDDLLELAGLDPIGGPSGSLKVDGSNRPRASLQPAAPESPDTSGSENLDEPDEFDELPMSRPGRRSRQAADTSHDGPDGPEDDWGEVEAEPAPRRRPARPVRRPARPVRRPAGQSSLPPVRRPEPEPDDEYDEPDDDWEDEPAPRRPARARRPEPRPVRRIPEPEDEFDQGEFDEDDMDQDDPWNDDLDGDELDDDGLEDDEDEYDDDQDQEYDEAPRRPSARRPESRPVRRPARRPAPEPDPDDQWGDDLDGDDLDDDLGPEPGYDDDEYDDDQDDGPAALVVFDDREKDRERKGSGRSAGRPSGRPGRPLRHSDTPVIFSVAHKGGVGKSTVTLSLAQRAAEQAGLKVVVVDANRGQSDITTYLRLGRAKVPTIWDAARTGDPRKGFLQPSAANAARHPKLEPLPFGLVLGPPPEKADPSVVTAEVYADAIETARRVSDLVVVDTQIIEAHDTSKLIDDLVVPQLQAGAWAVTISDLSSASVKNAHAGSKKFRTAGVPVDRLLLMLNRVEGGAHIDMEQLRSSFRDRATLIGSVTADAETIQAMNQGRIVTESTGLVDVLDEVLFRVTGDDRFDPSARSSGDGSGGLLSSLRRLLSREGR